MLGSPTRKVTINTNVRVHETLSIYEYTSREISATWYDEDETEKIAQKCFKVLRKGSQRSQKYCMRGLEKHTISGSIAKRNNKSDAFTAVFEEQERQWDEDEETRVQAISDAYRRVTSSCQMWAQVVGSRDQQAVEDYLYSSGGEEIS